MESGGFTMVKVNYKVLVICVLIVLFVAGAGSFFTQNVKSSWYQSIKPSITPPNWVFPIAWSVLFALIAISLYFSWIRAKDRDMIALAFGTNFFINITWSIIFFYLKSPYLAFFNVILLVFSIAMLLVVTRKISKTAFYLLIPYFLWVLFASVINYLAI